MRSLFTIFVASSPLLSYPEIGLQRLQLSRARRLTMSQTKRSNILQDVLQRIAVLVFCDEFRPSKRLDHE